MKVTNFSITPALFAPGDEVNLSFAVKRESGDTVGSGGLRLWASIQGEGEYSVYSDAAFTINKGSSKNVSVKTVLNFSGRSFERGTVLSNFGVQLGDFGSRADVSFPITVLDAWYSPSVSFFDAERSTGNTPDDEGENMLTALKLNLGNSSHPERMSLLLLYREEDTDNEYAGVDLTPHIPAALAEQIIISIPGPFEKGVDYELQLRFEDKYESAVRSLPLSRSFANIHLSGASTGGVCFGGFSRAEEGKPLFQSHYPAEFYEGIKGGFSYSLGEEDTGGKWIDGRRIYRRVIEVDVNTLNSMVQLTEIPDIAMMVNLYGSVTRASGTQRFGPVFWFSDTNYHSFLVDSGMLCAKTSTAITGHIIIEYTKANEEVS